MTARKPPRRPAPPRAPRREKPPMTLPAIAKKWGPVVMLIVGVGSGVGILASYMTGYRQQVIRDDRIDTTVARQASMEARLLALEAAGVAVTTRLDTARTLNQREQSAAAGRLDAAERAISEGRVQDAATVAELAKLSTQIANLTEQVRELSRRLFERPALQDGPEEPPRANRDAWLYPPSLRAYGLPHT